MRGNKFMALIWIILAACLTLLLTYKISGTSVRGGRGHLQLDFNRNSNTSLLPGTCSLLETKEFNESEIDSMDINLFRETLCIEKTDSKKISVELYCPNEYKPDVRVIEKTLKIEAKKAINLLNAKEWKVIVKVPKNAAFSDIDIRKASGSGCIEDIRCDSLDMNSASGSTVIRNCSCKKADIVSHSGSVHIAESKFDNIQLEISSGSTKLEDCEADLLEINSTSGSMKINGKYKGFDISSNSGTITLEDEIAPKNDCEVTATSGTIKLVLPKNAGFNTKYSVTSGNYRNSITNNAGKKGYETVNGGGPEISVKTTSGSIHIAGN